MTSTVDELCAALGAWLRYFQSPVGEDAPNPPWEPLKLRLEAAVEAARGVEWAQEEAGRARVCGLLAEVGDALAALARSPPGQQLSSDVAAACGLISSVCSSGGSGSRDTLAAAVGLSGSQLYRWAQAWRYLVAVGGSELELCVQTGSHAFAAQMLGRAGLLGVPASAASPGFARATSYRQLHTAFGLLGLLLMPGNERTLAAFAGTLGGGADTAAWLSSASTLLQFMDDEPSPADQTSWDYVCATLVAAKPFRGLHGLLSERPELQPPITALLPRAVQRAHQLLGSADDVSNDALKPVLRTLCMVSARCLWHGLRQLLRGAASEDSPGGALLAALAELLSLLPEKIENAGSIEAGDNSAPLAAQAVLTWADACVALRPAEGQAAPALQRQVGELSLRLLPPLVQLAAAALQAQSSPVVLPDHVFASLHAAVLQAHCAATTEDPTSSVAASIAPAAAAALQLVHVAFAQQAQQAAATGAAPLLHASCRLTAACLELVHDCVEALTPPSLLPASVSKDLWQGHTATCRFIHAAAAQPVAAAAVAAHSGYDVVAWFSRLLSEASSLLLLILEAEHQAVPQQEAAATEAAADAAAVAQAAAAAAVLAALQQGSIELPPDTAAHLRWRVVHDITYTMTHPTGCATAVVSHEAALAALNDALANAAATQGFPSALEGIQKLMLESMQRIAGVVVGSGRITAGAGASGPTALLLPAPALAAAWQLVAARLPALPADPQAQRAAVQRYWQHEVLPALQTLVAALLDACQQHRAAARLVVARVAATRSCAFLGCASNPVPSGGPAAGEQPGTKRCSQCRAVWYCGEQCSHADWRAGHRKVCAQLAAERRARKAAAAAVASSEAE